jgi:hypothetical protein
VSLSIAVRNYVHLQSYAYYHTRADENAEGRFRRQSKIRRTAALVSTLGSKSP